MYRAYIKSDPHEDPEVLDSLISRLQIQGIEPVITDKDWKNIWNPDPFLFFRNAYIRFDREIIVAKFHAENRHIPYITTNNQELISVNPSASGSCYFKGKLISYYYEPKIEPLPVLVSANQRPMYFRLTINSILSNLNSPKQKLYIVASKPDPETKSIVEELLKSTKVQVEAVISKENLCYAFCNFGTKFFGLKKFIQFEDDGILPENTSFHIPFWTSQMNHRSTTANLLNFRTYEGNWRPNFYVSDFYYKNNLMKLPTTELWHYFRPNGKEIIPIGGNGIVIDSERMYKNFQPPNYNMTDREFILSANAICMVNIPVYHIGANYMMDYPAYHKNKQNTSVDRYQMGTDMRTGQIKEIDLGVDWKDGGIVRETKIVEAGKDWHEAED